MRQMINPKDIIIFNPIHAINFRTRYTPKLHHSSVVHTCVWVKNMPATLNEVGNCCAPSMKWTSGLSTWWNGQFHKTGYDIYIHNTFCYCVRVLVKCSIRRERLCRYLFQINKVTNLCSGFLRSPEPALVIWREGSASMHQIKTRFPVSELGI